MVDHHSDFYGGGILRGWICHSSSANNPHLQAEASQPMNSILTQTVISYIHTTPLGGLTAASGVIVLALLIFFLIEAIMLESVSTNRQADLFHSFDLAVLPLLFVLVIMAAVRFAQFMHWL